MAAARAGCTGCQRDQDRQEERAVSRGPPPELHGAQHRAGRSRKARALRSIVLLDANALEQNYADLAEVGAIATHHGNARNEPCRLEPLKRALVDVQFEPAKVLPLRQPV